MLLEERARRGGQLFDRESFWKSDKIKSYELLRIILLGRESAGRAEAYAMMFERLGSLTTRHRSWGLLNKDFGDEKEATAMAWNSLPFGG